MTTREAHEQRPGRARTKPARERQARRPKREEGEILETELALATDGRLYANAAGVREERLQEREQFQGHALTKQEITRLGPRGVLQLALGERSPEVVSALGKRAAEYGGRMAFASDGRVYVERVPGPRARVLFRGFALTKQEGRLAAEELHRMAFNVTAGVQLTLSERRKRRKQRERRAA